MFIFNLRSFLKIFFRILLFLIIVLIFIFSSDSIHLESESVFEKDGWTRDPNEESIKPLPFDIIFLFFFVNLALYYSFSYFGGPSYCDVGVQTEPNLDLSRHIRNISDTISMLSVSDSPVDTLSTLLSGTPSVAATDTYYPELLRSTELTNILKAQELYNDLLQSMDSNHPHYDVYKVFVSHAKRIFSKLCVKGYKREHQNLLSIWIIVYWIKQVL